MIAVLLLVTATFADHLTELAVLSAALVMNNGDLYKPETSSPEISSSSTFPASSETPVTSDGSSSSNTSSSHASIPSGEIGGIVREVDLSGGGNLISGNVRINSKSASTIRVEDLLAQPAELSVENVNLPQVLIYHTHTSEAFLDEDTGTYPADFNVRTRDATHSVVGVGDVITRSLNAAGIVTIHDSTYHDDPAYRGAYGRSLVSVEEYLAQYPSIKVVLDVHRDSLEQSDGTRLKPVVTINGQKAAQIMLVSGCDDAGTLGFPDWRKNLSFAAHLQKSIADLYPGFARPIYCWNVRYNAHVTPTSLLVEFGTEANTDEEVFYAAELFADALIRLMNNYRTEHK